MVGHYDDKGEVEAGDSCSDHTCLMDDKIMVLSSLSEKDNGSQLSTGFYAIFLDFILGFFSNLEEITDHHLKKRKNRCRL